MILGGRPDHRGAADIDLLDQLVHGDPGPFEGRGERIEVDDHEFEGRDAGVDELEPMILEPPIREQAPVDPRVERLDPAIEHLG